MTKPPSAEPDEPPRYRAVMFIDGGGGDLNTMIPGLNDDDAKQRHWHSLMDTLSIFGMACGSSNGSSQPNLLLTH